MITWGNNVEDNRASLDLGGLYLVLLAIGIINAWSVGVPWYIGGALGVITGLLTYLGVFPVVGQIAYWILAKSIIYRVAGVMLDWLFWTGMVISAIISVFVIILLIIVRR